MLRPGKFFLKREFISWLILALLLASLFQALIPQERSDDSLHLIRRLNGLFLLLVASLSLVSLALALKRLWSRERRPPHPLGKKVLLEPSFNGSLVPLRNKLESLGYVFTAEGQEWLLFERHRIGRWGTFVFHLGLFLVVLSFIYRGMWGARGYLQIMEGERLERIKDHHWLVKETGLLISRFEPNFGLALLSCNVRYQDGELFDINSRLRLLGRLRKEMETSLRGPLRYQGFRLYQAPDFGFVTTLYLRDQKGEFISAHYFLDPPSRPGEGFVGGGDFPGRDYSLNIKFYPNLFDQQALDPTWPGIYLQVQRAGELLFEGRLFFSQTISLGDERLTFGRLAYWTGLVVTSHQGEGVFFAGLLAAVLGAILVYFLPPRRISLVLDANQALWVFLWAPYPGRFFPQEEDFLISEFRKILANQNGR